MSTSSKSALTAFASLLILLLWFLWLRPTLLGGPATYLIISGVSMEPTFYDGDLVVVVKRSNYGPGDVIAYGIDDYYLTERYVIHRILGETPDGEFFTQGDNRSDIDPWTPTSDQVIGRLLFGIPRVGLAVAYLQAEPWRLAAAAGIVMVLSMVPLGIHHTQQDRRYRRRQRLEERRKRRAAWQSWMS